MWVGLEKDDDGYEQQQADKSERFHFGLPHFEKKARLPRFVSGGNGIGG
jgi:hypothetical protein